MPNVTRKNIRNLSQSELENLVKAFAAIQELPVNNPDSFFAIAGYHGEPFRGAGYSNSSWWGGYCNHGNVLFPTWHRAYLYRLEQALQKQVPGVALPYWNETEEATTKGEGIPAVFLSRTYTFTDGSSIPNPLFAYRFQRQIVDRLSTQDADYSKHEGYQTVRYPFSGLVGKKDIENTMAHNARMEGLGEAQTNQLLNQNVQTWLLAPVYVDHNGEPHQAGVKDKFVDCLNAPNYTVFSNTTSAQRWNDDNASTPGHATVVSLESPHNSIHLAVGGFDVPGQKSFSGIEGANGDMGENDTAGFDPIFFFHHCFIDFVFWQWQMLNDSTESLHIIEGYPGTNSVDNQGPTPGVAGGTWLTLDSPLDPFKKGEPATAMTSHDVVNIANLGYVYELPDHGRLRSPPSQPAPFLTVSNINRSIIGGSFLVSAWEVGKDGGETLVGTEPVLSRWHVAGCQNCQNHLEVRAQMPLKGWSKEKAVGSEFVAKLHTREKPDGFRGGPGQHAPTVEVGTGNLR